MLRLFDGPVLDDRVALLQGPLSWQDPPALAALSRDLKADEDDADVLDGVFHGLVAFLGTAVERGWELAAGVD